MLDESKEVKARFQTRASHLSAEEVKQLKIKTGKYETHLYRSGEGEAVLLIHGSGPGATAFSNWQHALNVMNTRYHVLAPDLIGFGESAHPDPPPRGIRAWMRLWVDQLLGLMDELSIERAHLVGNSLGGAIALHLVMESPERFEKVVLMGPAGAPFELTTELDRIWGFYDDPEPAQLRNAIRWFAYDDHFISDRLEAITEMRYQAAMQPEVRRSYEAMFPSPRQVHVDDLIIPPTALRRMHHPVLLLHGFHDPIVPYTTSLYFMTHLPNASMHVIGPCSHWIQIEHKDVFHKLVLDFLEK